MDGYSEAPASVFPVFLSGARSSCLVRWSKWGRLSQLLSDMIGKIVIEVVGGGVRSGGGGGACSCFPTVFHVFFHDSPGVFLRFATPT